VLIGSTCVCPGSALWDLFPAVQKDISSPPRHRRFPSHPIVPAFLHGANQFTTQKETGNLEKKFEPQIVLFSRVMRATRQPLKLARQNSPLTNIARLTRPSAIVGLQKLRGALHATNRPHIVPWLFSLAPPRLTSRAWRNWKVKVQNLFLPLFNPIHRPQLSWKKVHIGFVASEKMFNLVSCKILVCKPQTATSPFSSTGVHDNVQFHVQ
jgi:hypothetical protein